MRTSFTVKSTNAGGADGGSTADLQGSKKDKHKGSLQSLNKKVSGLGGSLMSLGGKDKSLKKLAKSVGNKVEKAGDKAKKSLSKTNLSKSKSKDKDLDNPGPLPNKFNLDQSGSFSRSGAARSSRGSRNRDPGVESDEEEDDMFKVSELTIAQTDKFPFNCGGKREMRRLRPYLSGRGGENDRPRGSVSKPFFSFDLITPCCSFRFFPLDLQCLLFLHLQV